MAQKVKFNFKEKEGKFFAPIVGKETKLKRVNGVITEVTTPKAGLKGTYGKMRLELPTDELAGFVDPFEVVKTPNVVSVKIKADPSWRPENKTYHLRILNLDSGPEDFDRVWTFTPNQDSDNFFFKVVPTTSGDEFYPEYQWKVYDNIILNEDNERMVDYDNIAFTGDGGEETVRVSSKRGELFAMSTEMFISSR